MTPALPLNAHVVFILLKSFYLSQGTPKKSTLIFLPKKNPLIENFTHKTNPSIQLLQLLEIHPSPWSSPCWRDNGQSPVEPLLTSLCQILRTIFRKLMLVSHNKLELSVG